ncbi:MAG: hypothetical protein Q7T16_06340 [Candidatus Burarchaeum sp.]|nr:hypothetical protein [Candidatus Burarchaeum sp.]MDO8340247.1 hypothetical protein [Candidatus Burarchaeum sp.]
MIENFQFYLDKGMVKKTAPNKESAAALMSRAYARLGYVRAQKIGKDTAPFIFEGTYEVLREASQALMELKGYKPYSHEAQISFLREFCGFPQHLISTFDRLRILRNKCMYGAAHISPETCKEALGFAVSFLPELKKRFEEETKS